MTANESKATRLIRAGLSHKWCGEDSDFFQLIDDTGGWPVGYDFVGFCHSDEREAGFCNSPYNDGWWTVIASADDYYLWKLSPEALQRFVDNVAAAVRTTRPRAEHVQFENVRGRRAETKKPTNGVTKS